MAQEDFTTYTETDPGADITITAAKIDMVTMGDTVVSNVYKDYGASFFNAMDVDYEIFIGSASTDNAQFGPGFINTATPATETRATLASTDLWCPIYTFGGNQRLYLVRGAFTATDVYEGSGEDTLWYNTLTRAADNDTCTLALYSDSGRTTLVDTLSVSGYVTTTKWQYAYGMIQHAGSDGANNTGYVQNMNFNLSTTSIKTWNGLADASTKTYNGLARASIKTFNGLA
jgi:hypothetical protein